MPTSLFTDAFTAADGTALTTYNASYVNAKGALQIQSNGVAPNLATGDGESGVGIGGITFSNDQYAQLKVVALNAAGEIGPAVRVGGSGSSNYYGAYWDNAALYRFKNVAGTWSHVGTDLTVPVVNDIVYIEASGTSITCKVNGVAQGGTQTDSSLASGQGGMCGFGSTASTRADDFDTGNLSGGTVVLGGFRSLLGVGK